MRRTLIALTLIGSLASQPSLLDTFWSFLSSIWSESSPVSPIVLNSPRGIT